MTGRISFASLTVLAMIACGPKAGHVASSAAPAMPVVGEGQTVTSGPALAQCYSDAYALITDMPMRLSWFNRFRTVEGPIQGQRIAKIAKKNEGLWEYQSLEPNGSWKTRGRTSYQNATVTETTLSDDGTPMLTNSTKVESCTVLDRGGYQIIESLDEPLPMSTDERAWTQQIVTDIEKASFRTVSSGRPTDQPDARLEWLSAVVALPEAARTPSVQTNISLKTALANYAAINALDVAALEARLAPELVRVSDNPSKGSTEKSRAEYVEDLKRILTLAPKDSTTPVVVLANGEKSASMYIVDYGGGMRVMFGETGRHNAEGKLVRVEDYGDGITMLHQSGVRPDPAAADAEPVWPETFQIAATGSDEEAANVEVVKKLFAADAAGDLEAMTALIADDALFRVVAEKTSARGLANLTAMLRNRQKSVAETYDIRSIWGAGDWVVAEYDAALRFKVGKYAGKQLAMRALLFARLVDGKISHFYIVHSNAYGYVQLGVLTEKQLAADMDKFRKWLQKSAKRK